MVARRAGRANVGEARRRGVGEEEGGREETASRGEGRGEEGLEVASMRPISRPERFQENQVQKVYTIMPLCVPPKLFYQNPWC